MHVEKYTKTALGNMLKHYSREQSDPQCRDNINQELTKLNYNLAPEREISDYQFIQQRLGEVKHLNRDDVNIIADWIITKPQDFRGDEEKFFQTVYRGMCSRYGEENVVSAWVHRDEPQAQPHMHFCFMPIERTVDKNNQEIEKLNAKAVLNRQELKQMHPYMEKYLERNHVPAHLLNDKTRDGNKSVKELKEEQAIKDLKAVHTLRTVQHDIIEPCTPTRTLKGKVVPYEQYEHDINTLNARLLQKENKTKQLESDLNYERYKYQELDKNFTQEHKEFLELQERQRDKEYLMQQIKEIEHMHDLNRFHTYNRDDITIGGR